ncbi:lauroyl acyltransferase [Desulfococcus sp.]|uniref:LpxL/LpxP family acyltransferase n=1 Tax=Desulfococcus sp. TaxID=2025834 RepID=UPI003594225E
MSERFYRISTAISRKTGPWFFRISARVVAMGFFLLFPGRVAESVRFYRALFPEKSAFHALRCAWGQYQNFTRVFLDRFLLEEGGEIACTSRGWEHLAAALDRKTGGVILMSHLGNWELAARLLRQRRPDMPLLLYMGARNREQIERIQKQSLADSGIRIIAVDEGRASPFDLIEGITFLKSGGLVSMTGDVLWHPGQRAVSAAFLGHEVRLPETPHLLALLSGAPLLILFTFRTGDRRCEFSVSPPVRVGPSSRAERRKVIRESVQHYADLLAEAVRSHPLEWYHFGKFLGEKPAVNPDGPPDKPPPGHGPRPD